MALPKVIAVVGTNASGKSGLGIALAKEYGGEIISADSRQVYKGLDLGSGKITAEEAREVSHHLLDVCEPGEAFFSVADFLRLGYAAIDDILSRGRLPFIVGGTGLYVSAITEGYELTEVQPDLAYRAELEKRSTPELYAMLLSLSPGIEIDGNNRNRVMRVLERIHDGDAPRAQKKPRVEALKLGVTWDRETLDKRIAERLQKRLDEGMIEEVEGLMRKGVSAEFLRKLGLEYRYITEYLTGEIKSLKEMETLLALRIRQFARRQMTWFRRDRDIRWLDMTGDPIAQAKPLIDAFLSR